MRLIKAILEHLLGKRYFVIILKDAGSWPYRYWASSYVYPDDEAGREALRRQIDLIRNEVRAHEYWETISFRSRRIVR